MRGQIASRLTLAFALALDSIAVRVLADVFIPAPGRVDCLPGPSGDRLYISTGANHTVLRYSLATGQFLPPFELGGEPGGMDIAADGSTLAVANSVQDGADEVLHLIDLKTGVDSPVRMPRGPAGGLGLHSVAFGVDGSILITSRGNTELPLRRIEPVTRAVTTLAKVAGTALLAASGDRQRIGIEMQVGTRVYDVGPQTFTKTLLDAANGLDIALDATGSQIGVAGPSRVSFIPGTLQSSKLLTLQIGTWPVGIAFHPTRPLAFINAGVTNRIEMVDVRTLKSVGTLAPEGPPITIPTFPAWPARLRFSPDGSKVYLPVPDGVREITVPSEPFSIRGATTYGLKSEIAVTFAAPVAPVTATNAASYTLEPSGAVLSARVHSNAPSVVVLAYTGLPDRVRVSGVEGRLGDRLPPDAVTPIGSNAWMPDDAGQLVNGAQVDFTGTTLPGGWVMSPATTTTGYGGLPAWRLRNGIAEANAPSVPSARPYAVFYEAGGYDPVRQEVLARVRLRSAPNRAQVGVAIGSSDSTTPNGSMRLGVEWRNLASNAHLRAGGILEGPTSARLIASGEWIWMRLRYAPDPAPGAPDAWARIWLANGIEPEPTLWEAWDFDLGLLPKPPAGFAGVAAALQGGATGGFDVDYLLVKAAGLPAIRVSPDGPAPKITRITPGLSLPAGATTVLEVTASGDPALHYQWHKGGMALEGMTAPSLTLGPVNSEHSAGYDVVVSNAAGSVTSAPVAIEVVGDPLYGHTFETNPGREWSDPKTTLSTSLSRRHLGLFRGAVTLTLSNTPPAGYAFVTADVVVSGSWPGSNPEPEFTGIWRVKAGDRDVYATSFSTLAAFNRPLLGGVSRFTYNFQHYPDRVGGESFQPFTGATSRAAANDLSKDAAFPIRFLVPLSGDPVLQLSFLNQLALLFPPDAPLQFNQFWGLDNVAVSTIPPATSILRFDRPVFAAHESDPSVTLVIERLGTIDAPATVRLLVDDGTALNGVNFTAEAAQQIEFPAGVARREINVPLINNAVPNPRLQLTARLTQAGNGAVIGDVGEATVVIDDDESGIRFSAPRVATFEPDGGVSLEVQSDGDVSAPRWIDYRTFAGGATAGLDFLPRTNRLIFVPGASSVSTTISTLDDALDELDEEFSVRLAGSPNAPAKEPWECVVRILDNDSATRAGPGGNAFVDRLLPLPDSSVLVGGAFSAWNGLPRPGLARLLSDGTLDAAFPGGIGPFGAFDWITLPGGGVLMAGSAELPPGRSVQGLLRLKPDLSVDPGLGIDVATGILAAAAMADGRFLLGGSAMTFDSKSEPPLVRLMANGDPDVDFATDQLDPFATVQAIALDRSGLIYIGGVFQAVGSVPRSNLARLRSDGTLDETFVPPSTQGAVYGLHWLPDGNLLVQEMTQLSVVDPAGNLVRTVGSPSGSASGIQSVVVAGDGGIFVATSSGDPANALYRIDPSGIPDATFRSLIPPSPPNPQLLALAAPGDGTLWVGGAFTRVGGLSRERLVRLNADGSDAGWLTDGPTPRILAPFPNVVASSGRPLELRVTAGDATEFLWLHNGVPVPGGTNAVLRLGAPSAADAGSYVAWVRNEHFLTEGNPFEVSVGPATVPAIKSPLIVATEFRFEFESEPGVRYRIEASENLTDWIKLDDVLATGVLTPGSVPWTAEGAARFVRVVRAY